MNFNIRMGIPEMQELWLDLQEKYRSGNIKKKEEQLYKKWGKALKLLSTDPGKVKNLLKDANENGVKISHQAPTLYDVVPKEEIAEFEELMRKTIADIVSEASSVACWVYVQKYVKHKTLNEMLQELPDVGQFILAMDTWFEKLMEK